MPFMVADVVLFCKFNGRTWKANAALPDGRVVKLNTGHSSDICECSPFGWYDGKWHLSLIAGGGVRKRPFHIYTYSGKTIDDIGKRRKVTLASSGFVSEHMVVCGQPENFIAIYDGTANYTLEISGAQIYRVSCRSDDTSRLLISGGWGGKDKLFTIDYNLVTEEQFAVTCDGKPAYKCSISNSVVLFADRIGSDFEDRRIVLANTIEYKSVNYITKHK